MKNHEKRVGFVVWIALVLLGCVPESEACPNRRAIVSTAPVLVSADFVGDRMSRSQHRQVHVLLEFAEVPLGAQHVVFRSVWGSGPKWMSSLWQRQYRMEISENRRGTVRIYPSRYAPVRHQSFTLGLQAQFVGPQGILSKPSVPAFVSHNAGAKHSSWVDQFVMTICALCLLLLWTLFRRHNERSYRIRIAAACAITALMFLAISPAMSWLQVKDTSHQLSAADCHLGDEFQCATYVPDGGANPMSMASASHERRNELLRWHHASVAVRISLLFCLAILLPALIWLMVVPTLRLAQGAVLLGASAAGYTLLAMIVHRAFVPSWVAVETTAAWEFGLFCAVNIVCAGVMVAYWSFRETESSLPIALAQSIEKSAE